MPDRWLQHLGITEGARLVQAAGRRDERDLRVAQTLVPRAGQFVRLPNLHHLRCDGHRHCQRGDQLDLRPIPEVLALRGARHRGLRPRQVGQGEDGGQQRTDSQELVANGGVRYNELGIEAEIHTVLEKANVERSYRLRNQTDELVTFRSHPRKDVNQAGFSAHKKVFRLPRYWDQELPAAKRAASDDFETSPHRCQSEGTHR